MASGIVAKRREKAKRKRVINIGVAASQRRHNNHGGINGSGSDISMAMARRRYQRMASIACAAKLSGVASNDNVVTGVEMAKQ